MIYLLMKLKEQWTEKNIGVYKTYNQKKLRFTKIGVIKMITENVRKQLADYRKHGKKLKYLINYLMGLIDDEDDFENIIIREMKALAFNEDEIVECLEYHFGFDMNYFTSVPVPKSDILILVSMLNIGSSPVLLWISSRFFSYRKCISIHTDCSSALLQDHVIVTTKIYSVARFANYYCCQNIRKYTPNHTLNTPASPYSNQEYFIPLRNKSVLLP